MLLRNQLPILHLPSLFSLPSTSLLPPPPLSLAFTTSLPLSIRRKPTHVLAAAPKPPPPPPHPVDTAKLLKTILFIPPGVDPEDITDDMVLPGSNIVLGPYAGHSQIKEVEFVKSSDKPKNCPRNQLPDFAFLGRSNIPMTFVFTKCDKMKTSKGKRPDENVRDFQQIIRESYKHHPPWIMTSGVTGLGRVELLLHTSQLRNYWDN